MGVKTQLYVPPSPLLWAEAKTLNTAERLAWQRTLTPRLAMRRRFQIAMRRREFRRRKG